MNKTLKRIINKTIEREYQSMTENYESHLSKNPNLVKEDLENSNKLISIIEQLHKLLPEENQHLISEFEETAILIAGIEARVAFKEGLILGLTELSYLSEVGQEIAFI